MATDVIPGEPLPAEISSDDVDIVNDAEDEKDVKTENNDVENGSTTTEASDLNQFLRKYSIRSSNSRFFTRSQMFISYRAYLSRTRPTDILTMDYDIFAIQLEEEIKKLDINTKLMGKTVYYELFQSPTNANTITQNAENEPACGKNDTVKIPLNDMNIYLCCKLCCGYLVDATTITECLHSFCKSCIVAHFHTNKSCPICSTVVHTSNPLSSLKPDIVLQDIVNKILPGAVQSEMERFLKFQDEFNEKTESNVDKSFSKNVKRPCNITTIYLEWIGKDSCTIEADGLCHKFIKMSDQVTISHICQFVLQKLGKIDENQKPMMECVIKCGGVDLPPVLTVECIVKNGLDFETKKGLPHFKYDLASIT